MPIKIDNLIEKINIQLIKQRYDFQSKISIKNYNLMYNQFIIVGPKDDPAKIQSSKNLNEVLKKIVGIGSNLDGSILIVNLLKLDFRKVSYYKKENCICYK